MSAHMQRAPLVIAEPSTVHLVGQTDEGFGHTLAEVSLPWLGLAFSMLWNSFYFVSPC